MRRHFNFWFHWLTVSDISPNSAFHRPCPKYQPIYPRNGQPPLGSCRGQLASFRLLRDLETCYLTIPPPFPQRDCSCWGHGRCRECDPRQSWYVIDPSSVLRFAHLSPLVEMFKVRMQGQYGGKDDKRLRAVVSEMWKEYGLKKGIMRGYWVCFFAYSSHSIRSFSHQPSR